MAKMDGYFSHNRTMMFEMQSNINCTNLTKVNSGGIQKFFMVLLLISAFK